MTDEELGPTLIYDYLKLSGGDDKRAEDNRAKTADEITEDERFWQAMLNADRNDYERICAEFGVADVHQILKNLEEKKKSKARKVPYMTGTLSL
ncbi:unnamed protein product [Lampetra planeri]